MDNRPIGIFDSGLGGLTAVREIIELLPNEDIVYLGDSARAPYGTKSVKCIQKFSVEDARFLEDRGVKIILVACGTASSTSIDMLKEKISVPIIGVIEPAVKEAIKFTTNKKIAILATSATVKSNAFVDSISKINEKIECVQQPCPLFVSLVENGYIEKNNVALNEIIKDYLKNFDKFNADTYILGCTHFPIIKDALKNYIGRASIVDSGKAAANELAYYLKKNCMLNSGIKGKVQINVTELSDNFEKVLQVFMDGYCVDELKEVQL